ncbi:MAG: glutamine-hydrolyzing GMP synthase [Bacteroidetes bacterium]|nr:glutamine-hydrolyzing GMP synthase [Bacteroidota bacterium]
MNNRLLIFDFGSQYTQLIARRVRELQVYSEIIPYSKLPQSWEGVQGIILSGGPASVRQPDSPRMALDALPDHIPVLGICYGAQLITQEMGGEVEAAQVREYGRAQLAVINNGNPLLKGLDPGTQVWMSHSDHIHKLPSGYNAIARTHDIPVAAFAHETHHIYGLQFHPEVTHTAEGKQILSNFVLGVCGMKADWTPAHFIEETVAGLQQQLGEDSVVCGLSGGVDSTVAALLLHRAIGKRLHCIFVNNGLLRKDEYAQVLHSYQDLGLNVRGVDASARFMSALGGLTDPELKRKAIGRVFIEVFQAEAEALPGVKWLAQGTIYPDVIESVSVNGPSVTIKSHHNVGGLPEKMHLKVVEPLRYLFKDEVRKVGLELQAPPALIGRHPFPGPGLAIRIPGEVTAQRVAVLQEADAIFIQALRDHELYDQVWQAFCVLLPVNSVGVMGDERTYESVLALRAVTSVDGMTADWAHLPWDFLAAVSNRIINSVKGINRVVYDISSKPPATIEWE